MTSKYKFIHITKYRKQISQQSGLPQTPVIIIEAHNCGRGRVHLKY